MARDRTQRSAAVTLPGHALIVSHEVTRNLPSWSGERRSKTHSAPTVSGRRMPHIPPFEPLVIEMVLGRHPLYAVTTSAVHSARTPCWSIELRIKSALVTLTRTTYTAADTASANGGRGGHLHAAAGVGAAAAATATAAATTATRRRRVAHARAILNGTKGWGGVGGFRKKNRGEVRAAGLVAVAVAEEGRMGCGRGMRGRKYQRRVRRLW